MTNFRNPLRAGQRNLIFDESTLRKLSRLTLVAERVRAGVLKGERRSTRRGSSQEYADYRNYVPGDDLRRLDWNAYARLNRAFIKLFEEEEDLAVHILLDGSGSMDWGVGEQHKFRFAQKLAAALGSIALSAGDHLILALLQDSAQLDSFGPVRGKHNTLGLLDFVGGLQPQGQTDLNRSLRTYGLNPRRPGLAFLISDLFSPQGYQAGLAVLLERGYECALVHLLAPDEVDTTLAGDLLLVDAETGAGQEVSIDSGLRQEYHRRVSLWRAEIASYCRSRGIRYLSAVTSTPWDRLVLHEMRAASLVKG